MVLETNFWLVCCRAFSQCWECVFWLFFLLTCNSYNSYNTNAKYSINIYLQICDNVYKFMKTNWNSYLQIYEFTAVCITYYTRTSKYYKAGHNAGELRRLLLSLYQRTLFTYWHFLVSWQSQWFKAEVL